MADSPITIPLNTETNLTKVLADYQETINNNFSKLLGFFENDAKQRAIDRKQNNSFYDDIRKPIKNIASKSKRSELSSLDFKNFIEKSFLSSKDIKSKRIAEDSLYSKFIPNFEYPSKEYRKNSSEKDSKKEEKSAKSFLKEFRKTAGKDFAKHFEHISDDLIYLTNLSNIESILNKSESKRIEIYRAQQQERENQNEIYKILAKQTQFSREEKLGKKIQGKIGGEKEDFNKIFKSQMHIFANHFRDFEDYLSDDQKRQVEDYQSRQEIKEKEFELLKILRDEKKSKYTKIKDKLLDKYNQFILKNRWFEKSIEAFKGLKQKAGHWLGELLKAGLLYIVFKKEFDMIWQYVKPEMIKLWEIIKKQLKSTWDQLLKWIFASFEKYSPKWAERLGITAKQLAEKEKKEKIKEIYSPQLQKIYYEQELLKLKQERKQFEEGKLAKVLDKLSINRDIYRSGKKDEDIAKEIAERRVKEAEAYGTLSAKTIENANKELKASVDRLTRTVEDNTKQTVKATKESKTTIEYKKSNSWDKVKN